MADESDLLQLLSHPEFEKLSPQEQLDGIKKYEPAFADAKLWQLPEIKHKIKRQGMNTFQKAVDWMDNPQDNPVPGMQPRTTGEKIHHFMSTLGGFSQPERISNRLGTAVAAGVPASLTGGPLAGIPAALSGFANPMKDASDLAIAVASGGIPGIPQAANEAPGLKDVLKQGLKGGALTQALHMLGQGANVGAEAVGLQKPSGVPRTLSDFFASPTATAVGSVPPALSQWQVANKVAGSPISVSKRMRDMAVGADTEIGTLPSVAGRDTAAAAQSPWDAARQRFAQDDKDLADATDRIRRIDTLLAQSRADTASQVEKEVVGSTVGQEQRRQQTLQLIQARDAAVAAKQQIILQKAGIKAQVAGMAYDQAIEEEKALLQPSPTATPFPGAKRNSLTGRFDSAQGPRTLEQLQSDAISEGETNMAVLQHRLREANRQGDKEAAQQIDNAILVQQKQNLARKGAMTQLRQQQQAVKDQQDIATSARDIDIARKAFETQQLNQQQASTQGTIGAIDAQKRALAGSAPTPQVRAISAVGKAEEKSLLQARNQFMNDFEDIKGRAALWDSQNVGVRNLAWDSHSPQEMLDRLFQKDTTADQVKALRAHLDTLGPGHVGAFQDVVIDHFLKLAYDDKTKTFANAPNIFASLTGGFNQDKIRELFGPRTGPEMAERFQRAITDVNKAADLNKNTWAKRAESATVFLAPSALLWHTGVLSVGKLLTAATIGVMGVEWPKLINKILRDSTFADQFHAWLTGPSHAQRSLANWPRMAAWMKDNSTPLDQAEIQKTRARMEEEQAMREKDQQIRQSNVGQNPQANTPPQGGPMVPAQ